MAGENKGNNPFKNPQLGHMSHNQDFCLAKINGQNQIEARHKQYSYLNLYNLQKVKFCNIIL